MQENEENEFFNNQFQSDLQKFEQALSEDQLGYYDTDLLEQFIDHFLIKNQMSNALRTCEHALYQFPYSDLFKLRKAQILSATGKLKESLSLLNNLNFIEDHKTEYNATLATVHSQLKNHKKAIIHFREAIAHCGDEEKDELHLDLAMEYEALNEYNNAISVLQDILKINPNNEAALYEIAFCYDCTQEYEKSIEFYERYIENHPYSYTAWYNLGNSYCRTENFEKAIWAYDYCTIINDKFSSAYFNMGNALAHSGNYQKAIEAYQQSLDLDGDDGLTYNYIGEAYEKLELYDLAIENYNKSLTCSPQLPEPWLGIGIVKDLQGFSIESINFIKKAVELNTENAEYWHVLGEAYEKNNLISEAKEAFEKSIELSNSSNDEAIVSLAKILEAESSELAIEFLKEIIGKIKVNIEVEIFLVAVFWRNNQQTDSLSLFEYLLSTNKNSVKSLFLHLPEAKNIQAFTDIIENYS